MNKMENGDKKLYSAPMLKIVRISPMSLAPESGFKTEEMTQSLGGWEETE